LEQKKVLPDKSQESVKLWAEPTPSVEIKIKIKIKQNKTKQKQNKTIIFFI